MSALLMPVSSTHDIVVIGASAGGLDAVTNVVRTLPSNLNAAVFIVIHTSPEGPGLLPDILGRLGTLPVTAAQDRERIVPGHIYVAPLDFHLLLGDGRVRLSHGPREHRFRPAVDPLFRSAAEHYGARVIGVVLSGSLADGTHGLMLIKSRGGVAIAQDPDEALFPDMPRSAIERVKVDHVLPSEQIGAVVTELTMVRAAKLHSRAKSTRRKAASSAPSPENPGVDALRSWGLDTPPSPFTCPDCGGSLWELREGKLVRYRCHVGHAFSTESLQAAQENKLEDTLWSALRAIEESIALRRRMLDRGRTGHLAAVAPGLTRDISDLEQRATTLRELLLAVPTRVQRNAGARKRRAAGPRVHDSRA
jgi:two-component system chemotaxis response regulator CheB